MSVSFYSFAMAVLLSTVFVLFVHLSRRKEFLLRSFGIPTLLLLYGLCVFRMVFPLELSFTMPIEITQELQSFLHLVRLETIRFAKITASPLDLALGIWLAGALTVFFFFSCQYFRSIRKVQALKDFLPVGGAIQQVLVKVQEEAARTFPVELYLCPGLDIPFGIGIIKKRILLPDKGYSESEFFYIIKHEYTHFCNHDLIVKLLVNLFCCIFWWNPMVYLLRNDIAEILELKCDRACTSGFSKMQKTEYLSILEKIVEEAPEKENPLLEKLKDHFLFKTGAPLLLQRRNSFIKERFRLIMKPVKRGNLLSRVLVVSVFTVLLAVSYLVVVQPRFDPPQEDIFTDSTVHEITSPEEYIYRDRNGNFFLVMENGEKFPMKKETVEVYIADGIQIKEE